MSSSCPPHLWSKVHLPAYISLDNATIHDWALKLSFRPRQPVERLRDELGPRFERDFGLPASFAKQFAVFAAQRGPQRRGKDAVQGVGGMLGTVAPQSPEAIAKMNAAIMRTTIEEHDRANNCSWVQDQLHRISVDLHSMMCLVPQQIMPLAPVTPDIHCPIEHIVGTVKAYVRNRLLDFDGPDEALQLGTTYEAWVHEALAVKCNGAAGRHHVTRSVMKQKCICEILRTPEGRTVTVEFEFGSRQARRNRQTQHVVQGTGGAWIASSRWT